MFGRRSNDRDSRNWHARSAIPLAHRNNARPGDHLISTLDRTKTLQSYSPQPGFGFLRRSGKVQRPQDDARPISSIGLLQGAVSKSIGILDFGFWILHFVPHTITPSPCHPVTLSPCHPVTPSPCHSITSSPNYLVTHSPNTACAALYPGIPLTQPPGQAPDPQR